MSIYKELIAALSGYYIKNNLHIDHFIKVYAFAKAIGEMEKLDPKTQQIVEIAALTHDVCDVYRLRTQADDTPSINEAESEASNYVRNILKNLNTDDEMIDRVIDIIQKRYDYGNISGIDHQILAESDTLVNMRDAGFSPEEIDAFKRVLFKTDAGKALFEKLHGIPF